MEKITNAPIHLTYRDMLRVSVTVRRLERRLGSTAGAQSSRMLTTVPQWPATEYVRRLITYGHTIRLNLFVRPIMYCSPLGIGRWRGVVRTASCTSDLLDSGGSHHLAIRRAWPGRSVCVFQESYVTREDDLEQGFDYFGLLYFKLSHKISTRVVGEPPVLGTDWRNDEWQQRVDRSSR